MHHSFSKYKGFQVFTTDPDPYPHTIHAISSCINWLTRNYLDFEMVCSVHLQYLYISNDYSFKDLQGHLAICLFKKNCDFLFLKKNFWTTQIKFFEMLEFLVFNLNFVPCKELISVSILIKSQQWVYCVVIVVIILLCNCSVSLFQQHLCKQISSNSFPPINLSYSESFFIVTYVDIWDALLLVHIRFDVCDSTDRNMQGT